MVRNRLSGAVRHLRTLVSADDGTGEADGELLERFIRRQDESAFELLVRRHGPMVLGVCRRVLGDAHDAEDAFQATFLILLRKGRSFVPRGQLANWLYTVAHRVALRARANRARRRDCETQATLHKPVPSAPGHESHQELRAVLDDELRRLPEKYRAPVVLCYLEGLTQEAAARQLGW